MRWRQITEGAEITCSRCDDLIGKAKELPRGKVSCGNCGNTEDNPYGYEHSKGTDEKFGRLVFTNVNVEEGTTQGTLKTSKGVTLGGLTQYGPKWADYDNGNWEAFCSATKKRKKGFPDKKKAVDWIVRQTRATMKPASEGISEAMGDDMIFGRTVPNWSNPEEEGDAAMFIDDPMYQPAQVILKDGRWEVWFHTEHQEYCDTAGDAENVLKKYGYTTFQGYDSFAPQRPNGIED